MFEQTELYICARCHRLLTEGDARNQVRQRTDPTRGDLVLVWMCGECDASSVL